MVKVKGNSILITSEKDVDKLEANLDKIHIQYLPFVVFTLTTILNQLIIDPIQDKMRKANVSNKVIHSTYLSTKAENNGETITFHVISDYVAENGFLVAGMIEYGRKAYTVPKIPIPPTPERPNPHLKYIKNGVTHYRKKVNIPAKPGLFAIINTINQNTPKVQAELDKRTKKWMLDMLKS